MAAALQPGDPVDLDALAAEISKLRAQPGKDASGEPPRTVVDLSWLERVFFELSEARVAADRLGTIFGGPKI